MINKKFRVAAGAVLLLTAVQAFPAAKTAAAPMRPEVGTPLQAAQKAIAAKDYATAKAEIAKAEAVGKLSPYESSVANKLKASALYGSGDTKGAIAAYEAVAATAEGPEKIQMLDAAAKTAYAAKDYTKSVELVQKYKAAGGSAPETLSITAQSLFQSGKYKEAAAELNTTIAAQEAAGKKPTELQLQLLANCALKQNDQVAYTAALEKLLAFSSKKETWLDLIIRTSSKPGFSPDLSLDMYRLRRATGNMEKSSDYLEATQLALQAGFPGEAQKLVDEAYQKKLFGEGPDAARQQRLKDLVVKKMAEDKAGQAAAEKAALADASGDGLVKTGFGYVAYGEADKGLALIDQGIKKGGLRNADLAKLHQGYAYLLAGKKDQAVTAFNTVKGTDGSKEVARLWTLEIRNPPSLTASKPAPAKKK